MNRKGLSLLLAAVLLAALLVPVAASAKTMYVYTNNGGELNMRESANPSSKVLVKIPFGAAVEVTSASEDPTWTPCVYNGFSGFVMTKFLQKNKPDKKPDPQRDPTDVDLMNSIFKNMVQQDGTVVVSLAKPSGYGALRWAPAKSARMIDKLPEGTELTVLAKGTHWYQVMSPDGRVGFIYDSFVQPQ